MRSLIELLYPCSLTDFLEKNWNQQALMIAGENQQRFRSLFSWKTLNHLLNFHQIRYPDLRLALNGKVLEEAENQALLKHCQSGATLILNQVHKLVPEVATFCAELKHDLGYATQANAYCSWAAIQGFAPHYDTHDAFILQVYGKKQWFVFADTFKYPLVEQRSATLTPPDQPYLSEVLNPGDVLYIPKGHWHYAVAAEEPSLHLTVGIHCKTGIDFLEWLVEQLKNDVDWRRSLPLHFGNESTQSHLLALLQLLSQRCQDTTLVDHYRSHLNSLGRPIAPFSLPQQAGFELFRQGKATKFYFPKFQTVQVLELAENDGFKILTSGKEITIRGVSRSLIDRLFNSTPFTGDDLLSWLPDFDWEIDILPLISQLVTEGIIFVADES
jgi:hypothetical protein